MALTCSFIIHITIHFLLSSILPYPSTALLCTFTAVCTQSSKWRSQSIISYELQGKERGSLDASVGSWALTRTLKLNWTSHPYTRPGQTSYLYSLIIALSTACPHGVPIYNCFIDPCTTASCPNYPQARCVSNYCGGCNYNFFDSAGTDVTDRCCKCFTLVLVPRSSQLYKSFLPCACMRAQCRVGQLLCPSSLSVNLSVYLSLSLSAPEMTSSR